MFLWYLKQSLLLALDFLDVEFEFFAFEDVSVGSSALSGSAGDSYQKLLVVELFSNKRVNNSLLKSGIQFSLYGLRLLGFDHCFFFTLWL